MTHHPITSVQCHRTGVHRRHEITNGTVDATCPGLDADQVREALNARDPLPERSKDPWAAAIDALGPDPQPWDDWYVAPDAEGTLTVWDGSYEPARVLLLKSRSIPALWDKVTKGLRVMVEDPGYEALVEAACPHDASRQRWLKREDGRWYPIQVLDADYDGDAWDDLIDPVVLLPAEEA